MKQTLIALALTAVCALHTEAAVPPVEQLLPADTLAVLTAPDWTKARAAVEAAPLGQLWRDPELKPFRDKFLARFQNEAIAPLERELGIKLSDYAELLQGQATLAVSFKPGEGANPPVFGWCALIDAKEKSEQLAKSLSELKKKWVDAGKQVKNEKVRDVEFTTLVFTSADVDGILAKAFPHLANKSEPGAGATNKVELAVGQSGSLLLLGGNAKDLEKILVRQSGGQVQPLSEVPEYQGNQPMFRNAFGYGWLNLKPVVAAANKRFADMSAGAKPENPMAPKPDKVIAAVGLEGLKTLAFSLTGLADGSLVQFFLNVPEAGRKGLFKILTVDAKSANPPAFVASDVVKFNRWRLDGQKTWAAIETMIAEISPEIGGLMQMGLAAAGKDKDPNFDLKKSLIGNLGDDFVSYQKNPRDYTLESLDSPPSLFLIGSANAEALAQAVRASTSLMVPPNAVKEREFLGRKIVSLPLPAGEGDNEKDKQLCFAASGGYLVLSTDNAMIEEYLRGGGDNKPKPLEDIPGFKDAFQRVGGMGTGVLGYENQAESVRVTLETFKKDPAALEKMLSLGPLGKADTGNDKEGLKSWLDFSLLPPYEKIAKYFHFSVYTGAATPEGLGVKVFSPTPPALRK